MQVHFVPGHPNKLLSASVDGLMCLFDTSGEINDDDHLLSVSEIIMFSFCYLLLHACLLTLCISAIHVNDVLRLD